MLRQFHWQHCKCNKFISDLTEGSWEVEDRKTVVSRAISQVQSNIKGEYKQQAARQTYVLVCSPRRFLNAQKLCSPIKMDFFF